MSTRPRPRPKPRARVPAPAPSSSPAVSTTDLPSSQSQITPALTSDDDEDGFFIRNRGVDTWKKLEQIAEENDKKNTKPIAADSSDDEDLSSSPSRKGGKPKKKKYKDKVPEWTKNEDAIQISSEDSDEDLLDRVENGAAWLKRSSREPDRNERKKRQRSRSKSITPPPDLSEEYLQNARERVRRMLNQDRAPSPIYIPDDSIDNIELDPELAKIAAQVHSDAARQRSVDPIHSRGVTPVLEGGPEAVTIKVRWKYHPLNQAGKPQVWGFKMRRHDSFKQVFDEIADIAGVLAEHIIVSYNGKRVFPSASPHGVGVWAEAELEACEKTTFEYIRSQRRRSPSAHPTDDPLKPSDPHRLLTPTLEESTSDQDTSPGSDSEEKQAADDKFKLTLRGKDTKEVTLTVRPATKCSAILKAFLKSTGLADKYPDPTLPAPAPALMPVAKRRGRKKAQVQVQGVGQGWVGPQLVVDGEKLGLDAEIGVADLEDGDLVEVVGL